MRNTILINKGHDLRISGVPKNHYAELIQIKSVCVMPLEFRNVKPKLIIKKDDKVVGILTGRQKEPLLPIDYHNDSTNKFAKPPRS